MVNPTSLLTAEYIAIVVITSTTASLYTYRYFRLRRSLREQDRYQYLIVIGIAISFMGHALDNLYWFTARTFALYDFLSHLYPVIILIKMGAAIGAGFHLAAWLLVKYGRYGPHYMIALFFAVWAISYFVLEHFK